MTRYVNFSSKHKPEKEDRKGIRVHRLYFAVPPTGKFDA